MFKKTLAVSLAAAAAGLGLLTSLPGVASAADTTFPNADYGFDGNANLIVGGGSTTVYKIAQGFADLYDSSQSCATNNANYNPSSGSPAAYPQASPSFNQCSPTAQTYSGVSAGGNYDGDTVAIAAPNGSSTGIASLNGNHAGTAGTFAYEGTNASIQTTPGDANGLSNGYGTVDLGLSSRAAKTSGGNCAGGDELVCDTFWGVAADGVEVFTWGSTVGGASDATSFANTGGFTGTDLYNIWECKDTTWGQLTNYAAAVAKGDSVPPATAPIVPWSMNSNSGTYADFNSYVAANDGSLPFTMDDQVAQYSATNPGGSATSPTPPAGKCARELSSTSNPLPLENDVKPLLTDVQNNQGALSTNAMSTNNPANWIWAGSFGLLTAYSYLSNPTLFGNSYSTTANPVNGTPPSTAVIGNGSYPILRVLSLVTKKTDADCPVTSGACTFAGGPVNANGTTDMKVNGAASGKGGAVREFIRFVCRTKAENTIPAAAGGGFSPTDPYSGTADYNGVGSVISSSGFTLPPTALRSPGSNCDVKSAG